MRDRVLAAACIAHAAALQLTISLPVCRLGGAKFSGGTGALYGGIRPGVGHRPRASQSVRMDLKELTPVPAKLEYLGSRARMRLYDLNGDGLIYPAEFNEWVDNSVERVTARSTGEEVHTCVGGVWAVHNSERG